MSEDLFDGALTLEDDLYTRGYNQGYEDGKRAGKIEGRSFGMSKGFEKFSESGRLYSRAVVWANRLPSSATGSDRTNLTSASGDSEAQEAVAESISGEKPSLMLPPLPDNARLTKNVESVHALMEPGTLSTENSDEAVQDFDERLRKAQGKVRVIERAIGAKTLKDGEA
ncbi:hypothetical protein jhhlp_006357 [Lomentospora prolificans]|uniref:Essential protein Yae1 N-terminal domain-containing protein n=1 Tax=Lomentospora prolificans TaxID=41688 RepID=A0A2N3N5N7_9PEZI|nr:hypothetical protein jhhlp_006357 [Lomentospora prolificans]